MQILLASLPEIVPEVSIRHVGEDDQERFGLLHHLQQSHHVGVAAKLGQQLGLPQEVFTHFVISIICKGSQLMT